MCYWVSTKVVHTTASQASLLLEITNLASIEVFEAMYDDYHLQRIYSRSLLDEVMFRIGSILST